MNDKSYWRRFTLTEAAVIAVVSFLTGAVAHWLFGRFLFWLTWG